MGILYYCTCHFSCLSGIMVRVSLNYCGLVGWESGGCVSASSPSSVVLGPPSVVSPGPWGLLCRVILEVAVTIGAVLVYGWGSFGVAASSIPARDVWEGA